MATKLKIILSIVLLCTGACLQNTPSTFSSPDNFFEFEKPAIWSLEIEQENTYVFYNGKNWKGNFRISHASFVGKDGLSGKQLSSRHIANMLEENEGAIETQIGNRVTVHFNQDVEQDGNALNIDFWLFSIDSTIFICSFAVDQNLIDHPETQQEIQYCRQAIASLKLKEN